LASSEGRRVVDWNAFEVGEVDLDVGGAVRGRDAKDMNAVFEKWKDDAYMWLVTNAEVASMVVGWD
jgi:hypothetical protein